MTVYELIQKLQLLRPDAPVVIDDADTRGGSSEHGYLLNIQEVKTLPNGAVAIGGYYGDEVNP